MFQITLKNELLYTKPIVTLHHRYVKIGHYICLSPTYKQGANLCLKFKSISPFPPSRIFHV